MDDNCGEWMESMGVANGRGYQEVGVASRWNLWVWLVSVVVRRYNIINPRRACAARVTVVVLCVCLSVCMSEHAILAVRAVRSITKDAIVLSVRFAAILKRRFS